MVKILGENKTFVFVNDVGERLTLLDINDLTNNKSRFAAWEATDLNGNKRQTQSVNDLVNSVGASLRGKQAVAQILALYLSVGELWKKPTPYKFLRIGGTVKDEFSKELSALLQIFGDENRLYSLMPLLKPLIKDFSGKPGKLPDNAVPIFMDLTKLSLPNAEYDVIITEDVPVDDKTGYSEKIVAALRPGGRIIHIGKDKEMLAAWQNKLPQANLMTVTPEYALLTAEISAKDRILATSNDKLRHKQAAWLLWDNLRDKLHELPSADTGKIDAAIEAAAQLSKHLLAASGEFFADDLPYFTNRLKETLIDYRLGFAAFTDVKTAKNALQKEFSVALVA